MSYEDIRAPVLWQRPHAKIYSYNQELGGSYYQPMIDYVEAKDRQGVFFERPSERIHLPLPSEQCMKKHEDRYKSMGILPFILKYDIQQGLRFRGVQAGQVPGEGLQPTDQGDEWSNWYER